MRNNKTIIKGFERVLILFAEISKRKVLLKGPKGQLISKADLKVFI